MPALDVWVGPRRVGTFSEERRADGSLFAFEYLPGTAPEDLVSLTMTPDPDGARRFETRSFPPPFDMILPEGERRARIEEARKILRTDAFSLLSYVGSNPVNRVRFLAPGSLPGSDVPVLPTPPEIADCEAGRALFQQLVRQLDLRQGIAGVQPKILGASGAFSDKLSSDLRHFRGSTHILKSSTARYPYLAVNEHLCLEVFSAAGLPVPATTLSADGELLLVQRFDIQPDGTVLGFEEAAALMGETSANKYQGDYGSLIDSLAEFVDAATEEDLRHALTQSVMLNHLLGNGDAHLKNFGLLYANQDAVRLAPLYDCVSTVAYLPDDVPALALSFDWYSKAWCPRVKLEEFAQTHGRLSMAQTQRMIDSCKNAVAGGIERVHRRMEEIPGFAETGARLTTLWNDRINSL